MNFLAGNFEPSFMGFEVDSVEFFFAIAAHPVFEATPKGSTNAR